MDSLPTNRFDALAQKVRQVIAKEPGYFAIAVIDLASGQKWSHGSIPMRSASLIKLFIMAEAFAQIHAGQLNPADRLAFSESDRVGGAGLLQELPAGTSRTLLELIELMITESDNIATNLLIERLGMAQINARIQTLGYQDSVLRRRMMDFAAAAAGQEVGQALGHASIIDIGGVVQPGGQHAVVALGLVGDGVLSLGDPEAHGVVLLFTL